MAHRIKFSLDTGKSHPEFAHDARAVYEGLRENAASPNPPIAVEDVKSTIDAYFSAITIASCYGAPYSRFPECALFPVDGNAVVASLPFPFFSKRGEGR